mmetsp:Transcript_14102/g.28398  ORF Transcript_14102/g.28398 Transcript_14102/m.28398 type:complete len:316 (-) Transcript_14102:156-1103(-)
MPAPTSEEAKRINALINRAEKEGTAATLKSRRASVGGPSPLRLAFNANEDGDCTARNEASQINALINRRERARSVGIFSQSGAEEMDYMMGVINAQRAARTNSGDTIASWQTSEDDAVSSNDSRGNSSSADSRKPTGSSSLTPPSIPRSLRAAGLRVPKLPREDTPVVLPSPTDSEAAEVASLRELLQSGPQSRRRPSSVRFSSRSHAQTAMTHHSLQPQPQLATVRVVAKEANSPFGINHAFFAARTGLGGVLRTQSAPFGVSTPRALQPTLGGEDNAVVNVATSSLHGDTLSCLCNIAGLRLFHLIMRVCKGW